MSSSPPSRSSGSVRTWAGGAPLRSRSRRLHSGRRRDARAWAAAAWKISQLTDGELIGRRAEIERKLAVLADNSPRVALLRGELGEIADEEKDRVQLAIRTPSLETPGRHPSPAAHNPASRQAHSANSNSARALT
jgi:hypothetical protein